MIGSWRPIQLHLSAIRRGSLHPCARRLFSAASARTSRVLETHISYVLLTGKHAYKIKKNVRLGFLDFTTLAARRFYCEQELKLNRRLAPALYLDVVAITGTIDAPVLGGDGPALEYAVKMLEFPQEALASQLLSRNELGVADIDVLAAKVAAFHAKIEVAAPDIAFGRPDGILRIALQNFAQIRPLLAAPADRAELDALALWAEREHKAHHAAFIERQRGGFIRECHGDLHLGNIARIEGEITIFDCIEFNDAMRWIDVMSEVAFTVMDLQDRGRADLGHRFLNAYLEITGDYAGLSVLRFYLAYRAMVRAMVARLRAVQLGSGDARRAVLAEYHGYVESGPVLRPTAATGNHSHAWSCRVRQDDPLAGACWRCWARYGSAPMSSANACMGIGRATDRQPVSTAACMRRMRLKPHIVTCAP